MIRNVLSPRTNPKECLFPHGHHRNEHTLSQSVIFWWVFIYGEWWWLLLVADWLEWVFKIFIYWQLSVTRINARCPVQISVSGNADLHSIEHAGQQQFWETMYNANKINSISWYYTQKSPCSYLAHLIVKILIKTDLTVCASLVAQLVPGRIGAVLTMTAGWCPTNTTPPVKSMLMMMMRILRCDLEWLQRGMNWKILNDTLKFISAWDLIIWTVEFDHKVDKNSIPMPCH